MLLDERRLWTDRALEAPQATLARHVPPAAVSVLPVDGARGEGRPRVHEEVAAREARAARPEVLADGVVIAPEVVAAHQVAAELQSHRCVAARLRGPH